MRTTHLLFLGFLLLFPLFFSQCDTVRQEERHPELFSPGSVQLLEGPFSQACELNIEALLRYDVDRLLAPYLKEAGLSPKGESFPNWVGLDGHIGGHYLSAMAIHYAATGSEACKERMDYIIEELQRCQESHGTGYVGGQPGALENVYLKLKAGDPEAVSNAWVPWYNLHKVYAGLRDAWRYGKSETARSMFLDLCDWGISIIAPLSDAQMEKMLDTEFGGMNEVYADAFALTAEEKYLHAARRFTHHELFDSMVAGVDNLDNMHANTQVPKAVGFQRVAELSGDGQYARAAQFFWETVVQHRSLSFGGNSRREHFPPAEACREYTEEREGPESCNTYNMLKLTEGLFRMDPQAGYADYYERAMFNHILSTQHPGHGGYVYFTSARPRHYRVYSAPNKAMWCCVGTGMENHGKYGEFIYGHTDEDLYVNLFVASELDWNEKGIRVTQETRFPYEHNSKLTFTLEQPAKFTLLVRHPAWVGAKDFSITINGKAFRSHSDPSSYAEITRRWETGDIVELTLPMKVSVEEMPNVPDYLSIFYGPVLLGARAGTEDLDGLVAGEDRWGHIARGELKPITEAPCIVGERTDLRGKLDNLQPVEGKPLHFTCPGLFQQTGGKEMVLEPFFGIHDSRYIIYWHTMTTNEFEAMNEVREQEEKRRLMLDQRTVDRVNPGEQQPEADHLMKESGSESGYFRQESFRHAGNGGYFSYNLLTGGQENLLLMVRYWGNEGGNREFDIFVDDKLLVTENTVDKWNRNAFVDMEYPIPEEMLKGKDSIRVRFQSGHNSMAGGVFGVRLLKP